MAGAQARVAAAFAPAAFLLQYREAIGMRLVGSSWPGDPMDGGGMEERSTGG